MKPISDIADRTLGNWAAVYSDRKLPPSFLTYARPYAEAMRSMTTLRDPYYLDSGHDIVCRFLSNTASWRGPFARGIREELREHLEAFHADPNYPLEKTK